LAKPNRQLKGGKKLDPKEKRVPLKQEVYEKLGDKAKAVVKTPDELGSEIVLEKATAETGEPAKKERKGKSAEKKSEAQKETAVFPAKGMINAYGFLHLSNGVAEAFGVPKDKKTPVAIDFKEGALIIRKA
jgi:hypothetical protein